MVKRGGQTSLRAQYVQRFVRSIQNEYTDITNQRADIKKYIGTQYVLLILLFRKSLSLYI